MEVVVIAIVLVAIVVVGEALLGLAGSAITSLVSPIIGTPVVLAFAVLGVLSSARALMRMARAWWRHVREHYLTRTVEIERRVVVERIVEKPVLLVNREIELRTALAHLPFTQLEREELLAYVLEETRGLPKKLGNE